MIFTKWRHSLSVRIGLDHIDSNMPCQDNAYYLCKNGVHVLALSDGAGSKKFSQIGSDTVTKAICSYLISEFDALSMISEVYGKSEEEIEDSRKIVKNSIFNHLKKELLDKVSGEVTFDDLACTLLFVAIKEGRYIMGHIGDGVIAGLFNSGKSETLKVLSHPENGEQINITFFLTDPDAIDHLRITTGNFNHLTGILLMSDGPEEVLYNSINGLHLNCLKLFDNFNSYSCSKYDIILEKFLSTQVAKYSYDDLSLNLLYLSSIDGSNASKELLEDFFIDITNKNQIIQRSSYGVFLDNAHKYKQRDNLSYILEGTRLNGKD